ncbi:DNA topoisomerase I [Candidatus Woesearchaeota archaeon]|jgi:DNA topoisomerase I|nr:DNA topoisomerase I [Candidatus Woesearchaeota archaeon]MBT7930312.1 DNA topoisomerase I [Candidatus Woesearchaeota archaeon]
MAYELIITEKPSAAKKVAESLADGKPIKKSNNGVPYYDVTRGNRDIMVASAVGHLYTVTEAEKGKWTYPVFDVKWEQSSKVDKNSAYTSKYVTTIKKLAKEADEFTIATDYDIEGEVIGLNILKFACKKKDGNRMKYSTVTKPDLIKAYENKSKTLDWGQAIAGVTRHELDWYYGINLSRALTLAVKTTGTFQLLSSGRVQGPALKVLVDKEKEIKAFVPDPYWQVELHTTIKDAPLVALHETDKFWKKEESESVMNNVKGQKETTVDSIDRKQFQQTPPCPFDLTTLQTETYRSMRIQPKDTLAAAQELYTAGLISYPRTSSQQLPPEIGFKKLLEALKKQDYYKALAEKLLAKKDLKPNNGKKTDPAHPAIYPTGQISKIDDERQAKVYDIIVRRFLATFSDPATRETMKIIFDVNSEKFSSKGTRTVEKGWHEFYGHHVKMDENELPTVVKDDKFPIVKIDHLEKETSPPKRYTPATIIKILDSKNLGTKATRATIVENLYNRGYVDGKSMSATELGIRTCETLEKYCPDILDEELTRHFEEEMDLIREDKKEGENVLDEARKILTKILDKFKSKEKQIGEELATATKETRDELNELGKCPNCKDGLLGLRRGKFGQFAACNKYPDCKTTFSLPGNALIKPAKKMCEHCNHPMVLVIKARRRPQELCINPDCKSKALEAEIEKKQAAELEAKLKANGGSKDCPNCGKPFVLRSSLYGKFYGCSGYPKCRTMMKLTGEIVVSKAKKKTTKKKVTKKKTTKKKTTKKKVTKKKAVSKK